MTNTTFDGILKKVKKFNGDLSTGRKDYARAVQGREIIQGIQSELEATITEMTGFSDFNLPTEPTQTTLEAGEVEIQVKSHTQLKRPAYKAVAEQMQGRISGLAYLSSTGRAITGLVKEDNDLYVSVDKLCEDFEIAVASALKPGVSHKINYQAPKEMKSVDEIAIEEGRDYTALTEENVADFVGMQELNKGYKSFEKAYGKALSEDQKNDEVVTTAVTKKDAYKTEKSTSQGTDWKYVVGTMVELPTDPNFEDGAEINQLVEYQVSLQEGEMSIKTIQNEMPQYNLIRRNVRGTEKLYVGIGSVYNRIEELKTDNNRQINSERLTVECTPIV